LTVTTPSENQKFHEITPAKSDPPESREAILDSNVFGYNSPEGGVAPCASGFLSLPAAQENQRDFIDLDCE
jgi:hypothetical protein